MPSTSSTYSSITGIESASVASLSAASSLNASSKVCGRCPVTAACRADAKDPEGPGVWKSKAALGVAAAGVVAAGVASAWATGAADADASWSPSPAIFSASNTRLLTGDPILKTNYFYSLIIVSCLTEAARFNFIFIE